MQTPNESHGPGGPFLQSPAVRTQTRIAVSVQQITEAVNNKLAINRHRRHGAWLHQRTSRIPLSCSVLMGLGTL